jgi:hypothetical protein
MRFESNRIESNRVCADSNLARLFPVSSEHAAAGGPLIEYLKAIHPDDRGRVERDISDTLAVGTMTIRSNTAS